MTTIKVTKLFSNNPEIPIKHLLPSTSDVVKDKAHLNSNNIVQTSHFDQYNLDSALVNCLSRKFKITNPTKIQALVLEAYKNMQLKYRDLLIQAQTGSGKTLGFLLPILNGIIKASLQAKQQNYTPDRTSGLVLLIIVPTKELAFQLYEITLSLCQFKTSKDKDYQHWIVPVMLAGATNRKKEKAALKKGANIIVATPGRILDHLTKSKNLKVDRLKYVVIDEGDRFYELGFKETLTSIIEHLKNQQQNSSNNIDQNKYNHLEKQFWMNKCMPYETCQFILCSATLNKNIKDIADHALVDPMYISAENTNEDNSNNLKSLSLAIPAQLNQTYVVVPLKLRLVCLIAYLIKIHIFKTHKKTMIFVNNSRSAEFLDLILKNVNLDNDPIFKNIKIHLLYGDMNVNSRKTIFSEFIRSESGIMVCTDVCGRGLDIWNVSNIIQYDAPMNITDYVHRIGRTARIGNKGNAIMFLMPSEVEFIEVLEKDAGIKMNVASYMAMLGVLERFNNNVKGKAVENVAIKIQDWMEKFVHSNEMVFVINIKYRI